VELLLNSALLPFTGALILMIAIGLIEALGLSSSIDLEVDHGDVLDWLGVGRLPFVVVLVVFLGTFGAAGGIVQQTAVALSGAMLPLWIAVPSALGAASAATGILTRTFSRFSPQSGSTAFGRDHLVGLTGTVLNGRAEQGSPARARVDDPHGQPHYVLVEPDVAGANFVEGDEVLLVRRSGDVFHAIFQSAPRLSNWTVS
jgi:hypothetical protein